MIGSRQTTSYGEAYGATARLDFRFMAGAPLDQLLQALAQSDAGAKPEIVRGAVRAPDAIADEGRLAARGVFDRLAAAGDIEQQLRELAQRGARAGADVVEAVDGVRLHG